MQHIVEYDLLESVRGTLGLVTSFTKRIFQSVVPVSMTLVHNRRAGEQQILVADNELKFRVFDRNTFEILATYLGPVYDTYVGQLVSEGSANVFSVFVYSTDCAKAIHTGLPKQTIFHPFHPASFHYLHLLLLAIALKPRSHIKIPRLFDKEKYLPIRSAARWKSLSKSRHRSPHERDQKVQGRCKAGTCLHHWIREPFNCDVEGEFSVS